MVATHLEAQLMLTVALYGKSQPPRGVIKLGYPNDAFSAISGSRLWFGSEIAIIAGLKPRD